jgi:hypothetical protein
LNWYFDSYLVFRTAESKKKKKDELKKELGKQIIKLHEKHHTRERCLTKLFNSLFGNFLANSLATLFNCNVHITADYRSVPSNYYHTWLKAKYKINPYLPEKPFYFIGIPSTPSHIWLT